MIFTKMKEAVETHLGTKMKDAVINAPLRQATKDAGANAGPNVLTIIDEPTSAVSTYGLDKEASDKKNVLLHNMDGGTLGVSLLAIGGAPPTGWGKARSTQAGTWRTCSSTSETPSLSTASRT